MSSLVNTIGALPQGKVFRRYGWPALQLAGTLLLLAFAPHGPLKAVLLLAWWALSLRPFLNPRELGLFVFACCLFTFLNAQALANGIFAFGHPALWGMPYYEIFMWGFYITWVKRSLAAPRVRGLEIWAIVFCLSFALVFALISHPVWLLLASGLCLVFGLIRYHDKWDILTVLLMVGMGAGVEYTGVLSGEWSYPPQPSLGTVPPWFITMFGGVGLAFRRVAQPGSLLLEGLIKRHVKSGKWQSGGKG